MKAHQDAVFGSFILAGNEFALAAKHIQEVVNPPANYTKVPLSPPYLKGLFNLRGAIIPVIDLKVILNLGSDSEFESGNSKIAVVEHNGYLMGLLFDQTAEIFRAHDSEQCNFETVHSGQAQVIQGVFKRESGQRIVQILNVDGILALQNIPKHQQESQKRKEFDGLLAKKGKRKQCISFRLGPSLCALSIDAIQEIIQIAKVETSALADGQCIGTFNLRGTTVPIIDLVALLGYRAADKSPTSTSGDRRVIVMKLEQELFGLLVDRVESIVSYFSEDLLSLPHLTQERLGLLLGCLSRAEQEDVLLLDQARILSNEEILGITRGHSALYKVVSGRQNLSAAHSLRKTFIAFSLEASYAVGISEVRAIINFPGNLIKPPGLPEHFLGILNLRGELITIVDARLMYSLPQRPREQSKVLIFKNEKAHFGLIVDAVDSIVSFSEEERVRLPDILSRNPISRMNEDILEAVQVGRAENARNYLILNLEAISSRISRAA